MKRSDIYEAACIGLAVENPNDAPEKFRQNRGRWSRDRAWEQYCSKWIKLAAAMNREMKDAGL